MIFSARCSTRRLAVLGIATILLTGYATGASEVGVPMARASVVEHSREYQVRAAEELALLPEDSAIQEMLADYAVLREQGQTCLG